MASVFLLLFAAAIPHSIAVAQSFLAAAGVVWIISLLVSRQRALPTPLDSLIALYLLATLLSVIFSLEPTASLTKLDATALILIVPLVANLVETRRLAVLLILIVLISAGVSATRALWLKAIGQGVDIVRVDPKIPLGRRVRPRDTILSCNNQQIEDPADFRRLLTQHDISQPLTCRIIRGGVLPATITFPPDQLQESPPATWELESETGRNIRARGTYSHSVTYAEVMLQLAAFAFGLWLALPHKRSRPGAGLLVLVIVLTGALTASYTRASLAALILSAVAMLWVTMRPQRRLIVLLVAVLVVAGLNQLFIEWRGVGFYNPADLSIQYRLTMWEDGWRLIQQYPFFGIGMESALYRWEELKLRAYEQWELKGHFHSTPIQIAVERGLLGLVAWLLLMGTYLWRLLRLVPRTVRDWQSHGLILGAFGASLGFLTSGLLHYNFGDSEVIMLFWLLAGVGMVLDRLYGAEATDNKTLTASGR